jgi:CheY-like chemotaxis protein
MSDGGTVTISTDEQVFDYEFVAHHPWARPGRFAMLAVSDTGCGVPPEIRDRVFEPFFTTKEVGQGTGLGLASVYAITKRHDGLIVLESEPGEGSTFRVYLPIYDGDAEARPAAASQPWPSGGKETILLAEDDEMVRSWVVRVLRSAGYKVLTAADGAEAIELYVKHHDRIDLALLDVIMPRRSGREVHRAIRARNPELPVLFSSGYSHDVADVGELTRPDLQLLLKPYDAREVLQKVRAVLDERR